MPPADASAISNTIRDGTAKPTAFRYSETHAGSGIYDLFGREAGKTSEWHGGIGKLMTAEPAPELRRLIELYLEIAAPLIISFRCVA